MVPWCCGPAAGLFFCYQVQVVTEFVRDVPDAQRGQAVGIASSGMLAVQGVGVLIGGWVAGTVGVGWAVGGAGLVGVTGRVRTDRHVGPGKRSGRRAAEFNSGWRTRPARGIAPEDEQLRRKARCRVRVRVGHRHCRRLLADLDGAERTRKNFIGGG